MRLSLIPMTLPLLLLLLSLISTVTSMGNCPEALPCIEEFPKAQKGVADFGFKLMNKLGIDRNLVISPFNLWRTFAYAAVGAEGETLKEILNALGLTAKKGIIHISKNLGSLYSSNTSAMTFADATHIFLKENFTTERCYDELSDKISYVNMSDPEETCDVINTFIEEATCSNISTVIEPGMIKNTQMLLLDALYFKGLWKTEFDREKTIKRPFYDFDKQTWWPFMMNVSLFTKNGRTDILLAHVVELPYTGSINMTILFPYNEGRDPFKHTLQRLNEQNFMMALKHIPTITTNLTLPKFSIETNSTDIMVRALKEMGIKSAFDKNADFSSFKKGLFIDDVIHMAKITVDEDGVAVGSTSGSIYCLGQERCEEINVNINRPFIFVVHTPDTILFTGTYVKPEPEKF